jgi:hypothetical protein
MRNGCALAFLILVALAVGASALAKTGTQAAEAPTEAMVRDCRSRAEGTAPIEMSVGATDMRIGPLVLGNVRAPRVVGRTENADWPYATKTPVLLPARSRVVLSIAPEAASLAAFQHRNDWVPAVRFTACFERVRAYAYRGTVGRATFFPFGVGLRARSACVPVDLWIDGRTTPIRRVVPIGRRAC